MYHLLRTVHRWVGIFGSLFLLLISVTGFLLATKGTFGWVRPPERAGAPVDALSEVVSVDRAATAAFALGLPELTARDHIDRIDYRPASNVFKIVSKRGYHEVQVCGATGTVLQVAKRVDQLAEDLHDLSFLHSGLHAYWLPVVAVLLLYLSASGIAMFSTPVLRRWRYRRKVRGSAG